MHNHPLRQPFELHRAQQLEMVTTPGAGQRPCHLGDEDPATLSPSAEPRRLDHRGTEVVGILAGGLAHSHTDPHGQRLSHPTVLPFDRLLHGDRTGNGVARRHERDHEPVTQVLHLGTGVFADPFPQ